MLSPAPPRFRPSARPRPVALPLLSPPAQARPNLAAIGGVGEATTPSPAGAAWAMNEAGVGCARRPERRAQSGGRVPGRVSALGSGLLWGLGPGWVQGLAPYWMPPGCARLRPADVKSAAGVCGGWTKARQRPGCVVWRHIPGTDGAGCRIRPFSLPAAHEGSCESAGEWGRQSRCATRPSEREDGGGPGRRRA